MTEPGAAGRARGTLSANAVYAALSAASAGLLLVLSALITRDRGVDVFGQFNWALTLAMFGEALMDLGVHQITIRSIARDPSQTPRLFHNSLSLKALTGAGMFMAMTAVTFAATPDPNLRMTCVAMLVAAILRSYILTVRGVLQGLEHFGRDAIVVIGDRVLILVFVAVAVSESAGLPGLAQAFVAARVVALAGSLLLARPLTGSIRLGFDTALWRRLQREALPIGMFLLVLSFYNYIDSFMLGILSTFSDTGLYGNAYRLYEGLTYAPAILSSILTPRLSTLWKDDRDQHRRLSRRSLLGAAGGAVALAVPVWLLSRLLLTLVFGDAAADAVGALHILLTGLVFVFTIWILHAVALSVFQERLLLKTTALGALVNAGLNVFLIPRYGRDGAALATVAGEALTMVLLVWGLSRAGAFSPGPRKLGAGAH